LGREKEDLEAKKKSGAAKVLEQDSRPVNNYSGK